MRLGIDLGGTKTEIIALDDHGRERLRRRIPTARDYAGTVMAIKALVADAEKELGVQGSVGLAIPGSVSRRTGLVKNANSVWLNGKPFPRDLEMALARPVRLANDANCFALSEATDGAGKGCDVVFGVILGTGVGGGVVVKGQVLEGAHGIGGEWGHNPLPATTVAEWQHVYRCYCGAEGCLEQWLSGPALAMDFARHGGGAMTAEEIAQSDVPEARAALSRWMERLGRAWASVMRTSLIRTPSCWAAGFSNIQKAFTANCPPMVERHGTPGISAAHFEKHSR